MYEYIKGIYENHRQIHRGGDSWNRLSLACGQSLCLLWQNESRGAGLPAPSGSGRRPPSLWFCDRRREKALLNLISVSGIGPVSALAIIAADDNAGLVQAIESKNITYLTKFPKIGKKTAQQMVLDLEGKINLDLEDAPAQSKAKVAEENQALEEAMEAMCFGLQGNGTQENQEIL